MRAQEMRHSLRLRTSGVRLRVRIERREDDATCMRCGKPHASYPPHAASGRFCNKKCAAEWAAVMSTEFGWCRTHRTYWDRTRDLRCPKCPYFQRAGSRYGTDEEHKKEVYGLW